MTSHKFDPKMTPFSPLSHLTGYFAFTFIPGVTKGIPHPIPPTCVTSLKNDPQGNT